MKSISKIVENDCIVFMAMLLGHDDMPAVHYCIYSFSSTVQCINKQKLPTYYVFKG